MVTMSESSVKTHGTIIAGPTHLEQVIRTEDVAFVVVRRRVLRRRAVVVQTVPVVYGDNPIGMPMPHWGCLCDIVLVLPDEVPAFADARSWMVFPLQAVEQTKCALVTYKLIAETHVSLLQIGPIRFRKAGWLPREGCHGLHIRCQQEASSRNVIM